jgi:hypothetical protein
MGGKEQIAALQTRTTGWFFLGGFIVLYVIRYWWLSVLKEKAKINLLMKYYPPLLLVLF